MKYKKFWIFSSSFILLSGLAQADEIKSYNMTGFSGIKASAGIHVSFQQADTYSIEAKFNDNTDEDDIKIRMDGDVLKVSYRNSHGKRNLSAKITITGPKLDFAKATSGAHLNIGEITTGGIKLQADSGGSLKISGQCDHVTGRVSSGGVVKAKGLKCTSARAKTSSGGHFEAYAKRLGKGHSSSGGSIRIYGNPDEQEKNKSWSGGSVRFP